MIGFKDPEKMTGNEKNFHQNFEEMRKRKGMTEEQQQPEITTK
jgi:hypothetical protein